MSEGQKKRFIGRGMKPRGNKQVRQHKESNEMKDTSTIEGQQVSIIKPVLEALEGNETPGNLEPENGENSLQNLENSEATVAHDADLEAALNESGDVIDAEFPEVDDKPAALIVGSLSLEQAEKLGFEQLGGYNIKFGEGKVQFESPLSGKGFPMVGPQPDGSEKFIITIQEGYTDAVRQWAEADGVPVEQWLSDRLYEYVSTYGEPARGR